MKNKGDHKYDKKTKNKGFDEIEQVCQNHIQYCIKHGWYECKFLWIDNDMVSMIKGKTHFEPFQLLLDDINV